MLRRSQGESVANSDMESDDLQAIHRLAVDYAAACDRRQPAAVAGLFAVDGALVKYGDSSGGGQPVLEARGPAAIEQALQGLLRYESTFHFVGQHSATVTGDTAEGETYCMAHHIYRLEGRPYDRVMAIRYDDSYVKVASFWRFQERKLLLDWIDYRPMGSVDLAPEWAKEADSPAVLGHL